MMTSCRPGGACNILCCRSHAISPVKPFAKPLSLLPEGDAAGQQTPRQPTLRYTRLARQNSTFALRLSLAGYSPSSLIGKDITLLVFFFKHIRLHIYRNLFFTGTDGLQMKICGPHYVTPRSTFSSQPQVHRAAIESQMKCKSILAENTSQDFLGLSQPHGNSAPLGHK